MAFTSGDVLTAAALNTFDPSTKITNATGSNSAPSYTFNGDTDTGMFRSAADEIAFATGGTQRLTIKSDGDVGIGTSNPSLPLHVATGGADHGILVQSTDSVARINMQDDSSTDAFAVGVGATGDALSLFAGSAEKVRVASDGDVGIGTTSPDARLHVDSGATNLGLLVESTDAGAIIGLKDNSTSGTSHVGIRATGDSLILRSNNANQVTIATDGSIRATDGSASAPTYVFDSDTNTGFFVTGNNGRIHFSGNGTEGGYLLSTGGRFVDGSAAAPSYAFRDDTNTGMFSTGTDEIGFACGGSEIFQILTNGVFVSGSGDDYFATDPTTGTGNDAEWSSTGLGNYRLKRNSSLTAEKENISADLGTHLTADMIDSVVPKMWNRTNSPGYPEIGPLAEDMEEISPFLAAHGADIRDGTYQEFLTGINKTAYLSLLVLAVKDLRARVATLEGA